MPDNARIHELTITEASSTLMVNLLKKCVVTPHHVGQPVVHFVRVRVEVVVVSSTVCTWSIYGPTVVNICSATSGITQTCTEYYPVLPLPLV